MVRGTDELCGAAIEIPRQMRAGGGFATLAAAEATLKKTVSTPAGEKMALAHLYLGQIYAQKKKNADAVTELEKSLVAGSLSDLNADPDQRYDRILLGQDLAKQLAVGVGDTITVLTPQGTLNPFTGMMPRSRTLHAT